MEEVAQLGASYFILLPKYFREIKSRRLVGQNMWHAWERKEMCTGF
jgi:hypothetical protein